MNFVGAVRYLERTCTLMLTTPITTPTTDCASTTVLNSRCGDPSDFSNLLDVMPQPMIDKIMTKFLILSPVIKMIQLPTSIWQRFVLVATGLAIATVPTTVAANEALTKAQQIYPLMVADLERQCASPKTLSTRSYTTSAEVEMIGFICWSEPNESGLRSGQWLGRLPLSPVDSFGEPLTCKPGDDMCELWLPMLQEQYPLVLDQAKFQCAMRNGTLFTQFSEASVTVRCGFFATTLYDNNGDDQPDHEDQISVDIPMTTLPLVGE